MRTIIEKTTIMVLSVLCAMALTMNFQYVVPPEAYMTPIAEVFDTLKMCLSEQAINGTMIAIACYMLGKQRYHRQLPYKAVFGITAVVLSLIWLASQSLRVENSLTLVYFTTGQCAKSLIYFLGIFYLIFEFEAFFYHLMLKKTKSTDYCQKSTKGILGCIRRYPAVSIAALVIVCWSIPVIAAYPAKLSLDSWDQLYQVLGMHSYSSHHPIAHTLLIGVFILLGAYYNHITLGLFGYIVFQTLCCAMVIGYAFGLLKHLKAPRWLRITAVLIAVLSPYYSAYMGMVDKDILYSIAVLLFVVELIYALTDITIFVSKRHHYILTLISICGIILMRKNGIYILYPTIAVCIVILIRQRRIVAKSTALKVILLLMLSVAIANGIQSTMVSICHPRKGSIGEAFSLPLQQTARVVAEHSSEISNEEKMAIDAVVDYDHLAELYNPIIADPVKATWKPYATKDDIIRYIKTWFRMFLKYPTTYILATFNQNFYIITPFIENDVVIYTVEDKEIAERVHEKYPIRLGFLNDELNEIVINGQKLLFSLPIVGVLFNAAFCNIIMLLTIIIAVMHTKKKYLIAVLPVFLSFVVIILAPVFLYHPRYAFPIIYSMPVLLAFLNSENET